MFTLLTVFRGSHLLLNFLHLRQLVTDRVDVGSLWSKSQILFKSLCRGGPVLPLRRNQAKEMCDLWEVMAGIQPVSLQRALFRGIEIPKIEIRHRIEEESLRIIERI